MCIGDNDNFREHKSLRPAFIDDDDDDGGDDDYYYYYYYYDVGFPLGGVLRI